MSKRAPMKVNPVTGKMEAMEPAKEGEIRDGALRLPAKYLTAALDAGLGGSNGTKPFCACFAVWQLCYSVGTCVRIAHVPLCIIFCI